MIKKIIVNSILAFFAVCLMSIIPALACYMLLYASGVRISGFLYVVMVISVNTLIAIYWGYNLSVYSQLDELIDTLDGIKEEDNNV